MYASVRRYRGDPGEIDEIMRRVDQDFAPGLSQEPGFVAYHAVDAGDGELFTVTVFGDEAAAERSNERAAEFVRDKLADLRLERTDVVGGEVLVSRASSEVLEGAHR